MFDISGLLNKRVTFVRQYPKENNTHATGVVLGGVQSEKTVLQLLVSCDDGIHIVPLSNQESVRVVKD